MWDFCVGNPDECDATVEAFADGIADALGARHESAPSRIDASQLRVAVRSHDYAMELARRVEGSVVRPIAGDLVAVVMVDSPQTSRSFGAEDAASLGLSADHAYARALANTVAELSTHATAAPACGQVLALQHDYYYESSRLLDPAWLASLGGTISQPILLGAPSYDAVVVTRACDPAARFVLSQVSNQILRASSTPLSATVFQVGPSGLVAAP